MAIFICKSLIIVFLFIFPILKEVNSSFDGFGQEDRAYFTATFRTTKKKITSTITPTNTGQNASKIITMQGRRGEILEFWDPDKELSNRRSLHKNKNYPVENIQPINPLDHHKKRHSHRELSIYNKERDRYIHKKNRADSDRDELDIPINPLVKYENQRYDTNQKNIDDKERQNHGHQSLHTNNDGKSIHDTEKIPVLLNTNKQDELIKPINEHDKGRHHSNVVNEVLQNAMHRFSPRPSKNKSTTECYNCTKAIQHEHHEKIKKKDKKEHFNKHGEGYIGEPLQPINKDIGHVRNRSTHDALKRDHTFRARHGKKSSGKGKKHSTTRSDSAHLKSTHNKNILRSTRMTPMYEMQSEEEREKQKQKEKNENKQGGKEETDPKKKSNAEYDNRFVLSPYAIEKQFNILLDNFPNAKVESEILGRTASYNNILLLRITKKDDRFFRADDDMKFAKEGSSEKKVIFIVHALSCKGLDNLYSLTVETYLKKLLSYYLKHLDKFDIYLIPLGNPDGYSYLKNNQNLFWNKNMSPQSECPGVDLDRNFDVAWNNSEATSSCDLDYPGPAPFSEAESKAVRDVLHRYSYRIVAYIHVHAGTHDLKVFKGDAILYPKGYTESTADDDKYLDLRGEVDEAIKNANFKALTVAVDTLHNWYGKVTGTSVDYAATVYGIPYAMEMVMQVYQDPAHVNIQRMSTGVLEELEYHALRQVWCRVIDAVFNSIHKKVQTNDVDK